MYLRCPLQYKFRYQNGLRVQPTSYQTLGKAIHATLEQNYQQKVSSKKDLPLEKMQDWFSDVWDMWAEDTLFEDGEKPGEIKDDGLRLISAYHEKISPNIQPAYVEREFNLDLDEGYTLKGFIDLIDDKGTIIEHKTSRRSMTEEQVKRDLQPTIYALAYRVLEGKEEAGIRFDVMVRTKKPKIQQIKTYRTQEDIDRLLKLFRYVRKAIESEIFYPNPNFMCSNCGYKKLCERW